MPDRVLLIDDDVDALKINAKYLMNEGYSVTYTNNPMKCLEIITREVIDCIVLDVMMPKMDGFTLCKSIRKIKNTPIIFLTGKASEDDKLTGLVIGADDYITKPYSLKELSARIMVAIRRSKHESTNDQNVLLFPPLSIKLLEHKAFYNDEEIALSNREYELLCLLIMNLNKTVTFEEIGKKLWGVYTEADRKVVMVNASRLRKKIASYAGMENVIENVWSKGYKYVYKIKASNK